MRWLRFVGFILICMGFFVLPQRASYAQNSPERRWLAEPPALVNGKEFSALVAPVDSTHVWAASGNKILFYNGSQWSEQLETPYKVENIIMESPTKGWVHSYPFNVHQFDGTKWSPIPSPQYHSYGFYKAGNGTLLSDGHDVTQKFSPQYLEYFDGTQWTLLSSSESTRYGLFYANDGSLWSKSYVIGTDTKEYLIHRFERGTFINTNFSLVLSGNDRYNTEIDVKMINSSEGWLTVTNANPRVYHFLNGVWIDETANIVNQIGSLDQLNLDLLAVNDADVLIATFYNNERDLNGISIVRYHNQQWSVIKTPITERLHGNLIPHTPSGWFSTKKARYHYNDGTFTHDSTGSDIVPDSYYLLSDDVQWAIGKGMLLHYTINTMPTAPVSAQANARYFPETGHNLSGAFRQYYESNGLDFGEPGISSAESLALFGFPLTEPFQERNPDTGEYLTVQYFERVRMEYHPNNPNPYKVLLGRLGAVRYIQVHGWIEQGDPNAPLPAECERFVETQHDLCPPFRDYWKSVGSVQIFGLPIANADTEQSYTDGEWYLTLWTERERLEHHPKNAGTKYEILLGLLAKEDLQLRGYLK